MLDLYSIGNFSIHWKPFEYKVNENKYQGRAVINHLWIIEFEKNMVK